MPDTTEHQKVMKILHEQLNKYMLLIGTTLEVIQRGPFTIATVKHMGHDYTGIAKHGSAPRYDLVLGAKIATGRALAMLAQDRNSSNNVYKGRIKTSRRMEQSIKLTR